MSSSSSRGKKKVKDVQLPKTSESLAREAVDVVIPTVENNLDFLNKWRDVLCRFHIIIIQDGDQSVELQVPKGLDVEIHNRASINKILGPLASCISFKDSACRCFGFLVSQKRFIFTMDDDCLVAMDPNGELINPLKQHIENLLYPSTPLHFNPVYEPYRHGSQFTKGYPFDQRKAVTTAVSQGLCLNEPNYDAITKLVNPLDRNLRYVDAVVTIPKGTLFSMSGRNLAFDRGLIGPAMYFGLMGEGCPIGRYGDLWAGWCSKVICDHLGFGIKSGLPYIWHSRESDPFVNKKAEEKGSIDWQKDLVTFFQNVTFPTDCKTVQACYINLSQQVEDKLGKLDPYFIELAVAMKMWVEAWEMHSPPAGLMNILGAYQSNVVGLGPPA